MYNFVDLYSKWRSMYIICVYIFVKRSYFDVLTELATTFQTHAVTRACGRMYAFPGSRGDAGTWLYDGTEAPAAEPS